MIFHCYSNVPVNSFISGRSSKSYNMINEILQIVGINNKKYYNGVAMKLK